MIRNELASFSPELARKPELIAGNKIDMPGAAERVEEVSAALGQPVIGISAITGEGIARLIQQLSDRCREEAARVDPAEGSA